MHVKSKETRGTAKVFLKCLTEHSNRTRSSEVTTQQLENIAKEVRLTEPLAQVLDTLNFQGYLIHKGGGVYDLNID